MKELFLYDIFPEVKISLRIPFEEIFLVAIVLFLLVVYLYQEGKRKRVYHERQKNLMLLKHLDWEDGRVAANRLEYYASFLIENKSQKRALQKISKTLSLQKYHPNPPSLTQEQTIMIEKFIESLSVTDA